MPRKFGRRGPAGDLQGLSEWKPWFAWRPVRLHREFRFAWLRPLSRRFVPHGKSRMHAEYTDSPGDFPRGFGLKRR